MSSSVPTDSNTTDDSPPAQPDPLFVRVDDKIRCDCGTYAEGKNLHGNTACPDWPSCVTD